jgi:hypothetical protein
MKRIPITILLLLPILLSATGHYGQSIIRGKYKADQAKEILTKEFFKGDFWLMPTDTAGVCYFHNKKDARKTAQIRVVPVYKAIRSESQLILEPDYTVYVGLLFKHDSFLSAFNVWKNQSSQKHEQEIVLVGNPPPGFSDYSQKDNAGYVLADNAFLIFENGISKAWNYKTRSYEVYLPSEPENENVIITKAQSNYGSTQSVTIRYLLKKSARGGEWLLKYETKDDTITLNSTERIPDTELYRNWIEFKGKRYSLEYGGFRWIYNSNHDILVSYLPDSGLIDEDKTKTDFKIVKSKTGTSFKFIDSSKGNELLRAQYMKQGTEDHLVIQLQTDRHADLLELTAALIFWEMWMKK